MEAMKVTRRVLAAMRAWRVGQVMLLFPEVAGA
jgi:hypothetical protein